MTTAVLAALGAQTTDPSLLEKYQPGPVALGVVVLLGVAVFLLWRSMRHQLKRIDFDEEASDDESRMRGTGQGRDGDVNRPRD